MNTLPKAALKLAPAWLANIYTVIVSTTKNHSDLAALLKNYKDHPNRQGADILSYAFNTLTVKDRSNPNRFCRLLTLVIELAMRDESPIKRQHYRDCIASLLDHGANSHGPDYFAMADLLNIDDIDSERWFKYEHHEIVKTFLEHSTVVEYVSKSGATLAHFIAGCPGNLITLVLEKKPELANALGKADVTPLMFAIDNPNPENALTLLDLPDIEFENRNLLDQSPLTCAIFRSQTQVVAKLLEKGAYIEPTTPISFSNETKLLKLLAQAGYFLCDRTDGQNVKLNLPDFHGESKRFFLLEGKESSEYISTLEEMNKSEITTLEPAQSKRLHQSFSETLEAYPNDAELIRMYEAFSKKHPLEEGVIIKASVKGRGAAPSFSPLTFILLAKGFNLGPEYEADVKTGKERLTAALQNPLMQTASQIELCTLITGFDMLVTECGNDKDDDRKCSVGYANLIKSMSLKFIINVILPYVARATTEEIHEVHTSILLALMSASSHNIQEKKSTLKINESLTTLMHHYKEKKAIPYYLNQIEILVCLNHFVFYAESGFHSELTNEIKKMSDAVSTFQRSDIRTAAFVILSLSVLAECLSKTKPDPSNVYELCNFADALNDLLEIVSSKYTSFKNSTSILDTVVRKLMGKIAIEYIKLAKESLTKNDPICYFGESAGKQLTIHFPCLESKDINSAELKKIIKTIPHITLAQTKAYLNFYGVPTADILKTVGALNALKSEDYKILPKEKSPVPAKKVAESSGSTFSITPDLPIKQSVQKQKNSVPQAPLVVKPEVPREALLAQLIAEIRVVLNLPNQVDIFSIEHPALPKSRQDYCFGIWGLITGTITPEALETHRTLAMTGKVTTHAVNQAGMKPTKVMVDGVVVEGLKTKRPTKDERINSASVTVPLKDGKRALLFVFGHVSDHKTKTLTEVRPEAILAELRDQYSDKKQRDTPKQS